MNFRKSLLISCILHILAFILVPGLRIQEHETEWVEVSLEAFPDEVERAPDYRPGDEAVPEPSAERPQPDRAELPVPSEEYEVGVPVRDIDEETPEMEEERDLTPVRERPVADRRVPGRQERTGITEEEGEEEAGEVTGPVAQRELIERVTPQYPEWAEEAGITGEVRLRFWVSPEGRVTRVELLTTSGYPDFDSRAVEALRQYRFSELPEDEPQETQWGTITILYRL